MSGHFRRVLRALHSYARHLIKPNPDIVCLPEHLQVNKYWPWFEMVIERLFGVLKARFPILNSIPNFKRSRQRYVITACCCLHNFIRINNWSDALFKTWDNVEYEGNSIIPPGSGNNGASTSTAN
nr:hypothetical protein CFP56_39651 [Quercus suber]